MSEQTCTAVDIPLHILGGMDDAINASFVEFLRTTGTSKAEAIVGDDANFESESVLSLLNQTTTCHGVL